MKLLTCIWHLGLRNGITYWRLSRLPPGHARLKQWKINLIAKADTVENPIEKSIYLDFASKIK
jgi:hypothetical protein